MSYREARKGNILDNKNDVPLHPGPLKEVPNHHPSIVEGGVKGRDLSANYMSKLWPYPPLYKKQVQHSQWELLNQNPSAPSCNYMHVTLFKSFPPPLFIFVFFFYWGSSTRKTQPSGASTTCWGVHFHLCRLTGAKSIGCTIKINHTFFFIFYYF